MQCAARLKQNDCIKSGDIFEIAGVSIWPADLPKGLITYKLSEVFPPFYLRWSIDFEP